MTETAVTGRGQPSRGLGDATPSSVEHGDTQAGIWTRQVTRTSPSTEGTSALTRGTEPRTPIAQEAEQQGAQADTTATQRRQDVNSEPRASGERATTVDKKRIPARFKPSELGLDVSDTDDEDENVTDQPLHGTRSSTSAEEEVYPRKKKPK